MKKQNAGEPTHGTGTAPEEMQKRTSEQIRVIDELQEYSHYLIDAGKTQELLLPFGIDAAMHIKKYPCDYSDPNGLHGLNNEKYLIGLSAFDIADIIMEKLGIENRGTPFLGRGRQFMYKLHVITTHLKNTTI